jgi:hypothetical protein
VLATAVRYDTTQSLTVAQEDQARGNIFAAPLGVLAYSGMQINGSFEVAQEFGGALKAITSGGIALCDVWHCYLPASAIVGDQRAAVRRGISAATISRTACHGRSTTGATVAAGDFGGVSHPFEGNRVASLMFGSTQARPVTVCFWIYSTVGRRYRCWSLRNGATNRSCVQAVTVTAGSWQYKTVTFPGDTTGTWTRGQHHRPAARHRTCLRYDLPHGDTGNVAGGGLPRTEHDEQSADHQRGRAACQRHGVCPARRLHHPTGNSTSRAISRRSCLR